MFQQLKKTPQDPIIKLLDMCRRDPREHKIDVGVGVFKDAHGNTPIMRAVKHAETRLLETQSSKSYVGLAGDETFNAAMRDMLFDDAGVRERVRAVQSPGGCGALSVLANTLARTPQSGNDARKIWVSDPTWGNHYPLFQQAGFEIDTYPWFKREEKSVDVDALLAKLDSLGADDIVLLHGCCHNPTGANIDNQTWDEIAAICARRGWFAFFDLAYQGFGDGLEADAYGVRKLASAVESLVVAVSCSKNFGLYRDRVGCAMLLGATPEAADTARAHALSAARGIWSMPPDHGGAVVGMILNDAALRDDWQNELTDMRERINGLRRQLSDILREKTGDTHWDFIAAHRGMFSTLVLNAQQTDRLIEEFAVYAVAGGRINIAGLRDDAQLQRFADALIAVTTDG